MVAISIYASYLFCCSKSWEHEFSGYLYIWIPFISFLPYHMFISSIILKVWRHSLGWYGSWERCLCCWARPSQVCLLIFLNVYENAMWHSGLVPSYPFMALYLPNYLLLCVDMKENGSKTKWKVMEWSKWRFPKWSLFLVPSTSSITALNSLHNTRNQWMNIIIVKNAKSSFPCFFPGLKLRWELKGESYQEILCHLKIESGWRWILKIVCA